MTKEQTPEPREEQCLNRSLRLISSCVRTTLHQKHGVSFFMISRWERIQIDILVAFAFISQRCKKLFPMTELYTCQQLLRDEGEKLSFILTDWQKFFPVSWNFYIPFYLSSFSATPSISCDVNQINAVLLENQINSINKCEFGENICFEFTFNVLTKGCWRDWLQLSDQCCTVDNLTGYTVSCAYALTEQCSQLCRTYLHGTFLRLW